MLQRLIESTQCVAIRHTERLVQAGLEPAVGSVGDSRDNALPETINGLYEAEVIHRWPSWRTREEAERAILNGVDWFNRHLLEPIGKISRAEAEANCYSQIPRSAMSAWPKPMSLRESRGGSIRGAKCRTPRPALE